MACPGTPVRRLASSAWMNQLFAEPNRALPFECFRVFRRLECENRTIACRSASRWFDVLARPVRAT